MGWNKLIPHRPPGGPLRRHYQTYLQHMLLKRLVLLLRCHVNNVVDGLVIPAACLVAQQVVRTLAAQFVRCSGILPTDAPIDEGAAESCVQQLEKLLTDYAAHAGVPPPPAQSPNRSAGIHWQGGRCPPPPPSRVPSLRPATVPLTASAGLNGR